jgi:hypothetical protein
LLNNQALLEKLCFFKIETPIIKDLICVGFNIWSDLITPGKIVPASSEKMKFDQMFHF